MEPNWEALVASDAEAARRLVDAYSAPSTAQKAVVGFLPMPAQPPEAWVKYLQGILADAENIPTPERFSGRVRDAMHRVYEAARRMLKAGSEGLVKFTDQAREDLLKVADSAGNWALGGGLTLLAVFLGFLYFTQKR